MNNVFIYDETLSSPVIAGCLVTVLSMGAHEDRSTTPCEFAVSQNCPNPFNPVTEIAYTLPEDAHVTMEVLNLLGEKVVILVDERQKAGHKSVRWNGSSSPSGIYFCRVSAGDDVKTKRMVLLK